MKKEQVQMAVKVLLVFGGAYLAFKAFTPKPRRSNKIGETQMIELPNEERAYVQPPPQMSDMDAQANPQASAAYLALNVYIDAMNSGASNEELSKVNKELSNDMGLKVYRRRTDNKLAVQDLNDNDIIEYDTEEAARMGMCCVAA